MKLDIKELINYIAVFSVFSGAWTYSTSFNLEMRSLYFIVVAVFLLWMPFLKGVWINKAFLQVMTVLTVSAVYSIAIGNNTVELFMRQLIGIMATAFFFYTLLRINDGDVKKIFMVYLNIAFVAAMIGILKEIFFIFDLDEAYKLMDFAPYAKTSTIFGCRILRVRSFLQEPAFFCTVMMPAFFTSMVSFGSNRHRMIKRWKGSIIILAVFLSFSLSGYASIIFCVVLLLLNYRKIRYLIAACVGVSICVVIVYLHVDMVKNKMVDVVDVMAGKRELSEVTLSAYSTLSNMMVAHRAFKENPLFGNGLGSHPVTYDRYVGTEAIPRHNLKISVNRKDAGSLFSRLLSEAGLFGLFFLGLFIFKYYVSRHKDVDGYLWIISSAVLAMMFCKFIKLGHYFSDGLPFFVCLYYFSSIKNKKNR